MISKKGLYLKKNNEKAVTDRFEDRVSQKALKFCAKSFNFTLFPNKRKKKDACTFFVHLISSLLKARKNNEFFINSHNKKKTTLEIIVYQSSFDV